MGSADLAEMRRAYAEGRFEIADLAGGWHEQLERWVADAVNAQLTEPNAMVLATASSDREPSARTVLCKGIDARGVRFFTNLRSRKGRQISENPRASAVFGWLDIQRQAVLTGSVEPLGEDASDEYFASRPHGSQLGALASPQSEVIASHEEIRARHDELAARHPAGEAVPRPEWWGGLMLVPHTVEFWQGRPDRLHDRLQFRLHDGAWVVERLAP